MIRLASSRGMSLEQIQRSEVQLELLQMERHLEEAEPSDLVWIGDELCALGLRLRRLWEEARAAGTVSIDDFRP